MNRRAILMALRAATRRGGGMLPRGGSNEALARGARAQSAAERTALGANRRYAKGRPKGSDDAVINRAQRQSVANEYLTKRMGARSVEQSEAMHAEALARPRRSVVDAEFEPPRRTSMAADNRRLSANTKRYDAAYSKLEMQGLPDDEIRRRLKRMGF